MMHSINRKVLRNNTPKTGLRKPGEKIRIVTIGKIRFPMANKRIIEALGNDDRFELLFIGAGSEKLEEYKKTFHNITLIGTYLPEETSKYLEDADIINSYFGSTVLGYERMTSIRFSYGPYLRVPVLVGKGTVMEAEGNKYGFVYAVNDDNEPFSDDLYAWYQNLEFEKFDVGCKKYLQDLTESDQTFYAKLDSVMNAIKSKGE